MYPVICFKFSIMYLWYSNEVNSPQQHYYTAENNVRHITNAQTASLKWTAYLSYFMYPCHTSEKCFLLKLNEAIKLMSGFDYSGRGWQTTILLGLLTNDEAFSYFVRALFKTQCSSSLKVSQVSSHCTCDFGGSLCKYS